MRRAARIDANQPEVVDTLRKAGWSVEILSFVGGGFPDLLVGTAGWACLVEVKDGSKPPSARKLTADEQKFAESWTGPLIVAYSGEDACKKLDAEFNRYFREGE